MGKKPKWQRELDIFNGIKTTFILENNVYDIYEVFSEYEPYFVEITDFMHDYYTRLGYTNIIFFDPMNGFYNRNDIGVDIKDLLSGIGCDTRNLRKKTNNVLGTYYSIEDIVEASEIIKQAVTSSNQLITFVMMFASRYCAKPDILESDERMLYMNLMYASLNSQIFNVDGYGTMQNMMTFVVDKINDIPSWFFINNPYQKTVTIPVPDKETRETYIRSIENDFIGFYEASEEEKQKFRDDFLRLTEGMKCIEINGLKNLCYKENIDIYRISDAISLYKYGIKENPWLAIPEDKLINAEEIISRRVKGQEAAVKRAVDIIKRAATGMSGIQHSSASSKPRGIMFFAGPTGTGKTELAKAIAELLFDDEDSCIRFDMSEYQQSHSDQKLLGAPPGYVGYEAGGQLTNAIREKPFSILLFDEIEKADSSILDKFLQILEDGRMTDGQGNTVYFSECIIIFTSNLGIYKVDGSNNYLLDSRGNRIPNISVDDSYEDIQKNVVAAIKNYMRPELMNRIGDNIIVFRFIDEMRAREILEKKQIPSITKMLYENKGIHLYFEPEAIEALMDRVRLNLDNGGRGIGNIMETYVVNPLSRYLFDARVAEGSSVTIRGFYSEDGVITLDVAM